MRSWLLAASLAVAGCAQLSLAPPLVSPKNGGAPWFEVSSAHFVVRSDTSAAHARELAVELEKIEGAFQDLISSPDIDDGQPIAVVDFARKVDYVEIAKEHGQPNSAAFFTTHMQDVEPTPTVTLYGDLDQAKRQILQHELTHRFVRLQMIDPPLWLNEGLAEYNSTLALHDGRAWFGAMPALSSAIFRPGGKIGLGHNSNVHWFSLDNLPTVQSLLTATPDTFYDRIEDDANPRHPLSYQGAWLLVHMLKSPQLPYHARFDQMIALLTQGMHHDAAFAQAFAGVSIAELEQQYRKQAVELAAPLHEGDRLTTFLTTAYTPHAAAPVHEAIELSDAQVHLTFLRLRAWNPPYREAANSDLVSAQVDSPQDPEVLYWRALYEWRSGARDKALTLLRAALDGIPHDADEPSPREARYQLALYLCRRTQLEKQGAPLTAEALAALQPEADALSRVARSATALNEVAWYYYLRQQPQAGIPFAMRAVQADPTCFTCFDTLATLNAVRGRFAQAVLAQERALSLMPEVVHMPEIKARLDEYRQKAAAPSSPPPSPPSQP